MTIKITFISFWKDFDNKDNIITYLLKKYKIDYIFSDDKPEILFVGSFVKENEIEYIEKFEGKKILNISEPIDVVYKNVYILFKKNIFDMVFGCIQNESLKNYYKYPLYNWYACGANNTYININKNVFNENLEQKKFCTLINRHDNYNTRTKIYNLLNKIDKIDCPSKLFNNMTNQELNSIGNVKFINKYLFNLCPENAKCEFDGYITEKLMNSCLSGAIPIYFGHFDDLDEKIFNKNRIIFFNPTNDKSIENAVNVIIELVNCKNKMEKFYKQPIYCDEAMDTLKYLEINLTNGFKKIFQESNL